MSNRIYQCHPTNCMDVVFSAIIHNFCKCIKNLIWQVCEFRQIVIVNFGENDRSTFLSRASLANDRFRSTISSAGTSGRDTLPFISSTISRSFVIWFSLHNRHQLAKVDLDDCMCGNVPRLTSYFAAVNRPICPYLL